MGASALLRERRRQGLRLLKSQGDLYPCHSLLLGMCDWDPEEYAEYVRWVEAARARGVMVRTRVSAIPEGFVSSDPVAVSTET